MSTEKDPPRERSANTGNDREGRRRSVWHMPVLTPKSHSPDDAFQQDRQIEKVPPDGPPLDMKPVLGKGYSLSHSPEDARAWLLNFGDFKSQLNYVNIVVRPACRARQTPDPDFMPGFYLVRVITRDDLPNISPAADPKIISAAQLAGFVRGVALNASYFCQCWNTKDLDSEFPSGWRARLQQIKRLRERVMNKSAEKQAVAASSGTITSVVPGTSGGRRTPVPREEAGGPRRDGALASQLDFSSWTVQMDGGPKFGP